MMERMLLPSSLREKWAALQRRKIAADATLKEALAAHTIQMEAVIDDESRYWKELGKEFDIDLSKDYRMRTNYLQDTVELVEWKQEDSRDG